MDTQSIIQELEAERDRLTQAIDALQGNGSTRHGMLGNGRRGRRHLSAAARKRIADAMKARWAARKKAGKSSL